MTASCAPSLAWLYGLQRFGIKLGLQNIRALLSRLGDPQQTVPCLHVAGTNGKGSVSLLLAEICRQAGYRTGLFTSPHLHCFTERIRLDGETLPVEQLPELVAEVQRAATGIPVTFFEATTALALVAFRRAGTEIAVIETGMGGRLDATNALLPQACFITPVALDHQEHLGATLPAIAAEKAGIIKPGVPVVSARQEAAVAAVIAAAAEACAAPLWQAERDYQWGGQQDAMWFRGPGLELPSLRCALHGRHQLDNLAQALAGAALLRRQGLTIPEAALIQAGATARWPGRLEWFGVPPRLLLDGAHNRAGAAVLADYLDSMGCRPVRLVAGLSGQRRPEEVLTPLLGRVAALYATPVTEMVGVGAAELTAWGAAHGLPALDFATPAAALAAALAARQPDEIVVVAGSLYLVGEIRGLVHNNPELWPPSPAAPVPRHSTDR